jgi:DMSO reductase anchor subunit
MHPAYSVIIFTTASGAGYGLLVWLAVSALGGAARANGTFGLLAFVIALGLVTVGLLSSTLHLGRPERAWRAISQWRSSWLSREGVAALATFVPSGLLAIVWVFGDGQPDDLVKLLALMTIAGAVATVWCTGMIYQSLTTIRAWHRPSVAPIYLVLSLASGLVLYHALVLLRGDAPWPTGLGAVALVAIAALAKALYWRGLDTDEKPLTPGDATGLGSLGQVRPLDPPHTLPNFVMREMGYAVARRHAQKLRAIALLAGCLLPALAILVSLIVAPPLAFSAALLAVLAMGFGLVTERWLFFAEAQHIVTLYYGAEHA